MSNDEYSFDNSGINSNKVRRVTGDYQKAPIEISFSKTEDNITNKIGTGDDAKNSVVWHVITYSLTIYSCIVAALLVIDVVNNDGKSALTIVKDSWAIFTPIITLSLGYMFGKKEDENKQSTTGK